MQELALFLTKKSPKTPYFLQKPQKPDFGHFLGPKNRLFLTKKHVFFTLFLRKFLKKWVRVFFEK